MSSLARCIDMLFEVAAVSLSGVIVMRILSRLNDPRRGANSQRSQSRGRQLAVRSLKGKQQPMTEHEAEVAADVVCPTDVGCSFADVGGLQKVAHELRQAILLPLQNAHLFESSKLLRPPKGILLHGPPGTGKTLLAKAIAREAKFAFITINPARLCSKWYGESNKFAEAYFSLAHKLAPCVLFIDEIDCLFTRKGNEHEATAMLRSQFLTLWDGLLSPSAAATPVVVIAATNRPEMVDPAILRRLPLSFLVDMPTCEARTDILRRLLSGEPLAREILATEEGKASETATPATGGSLKSGSPLGEEGRAPSALGLLARATEGYSGSDLEQLCRSAMMRPLQEMIHSEESMQVGTGATAPAAAAAAEGEAVPEGAKGAAAAAATAKEESAGVQAEAKPQGQAEGEASVLSMRPLMLNDFREAMMLVRPSRNRFGGAPHFDPMPVSGGGNGYDAELYD